MSDATVAFLVVTAALVWYPAVGMLMRRCGYTAAGNEGAHFFLWLTSPLFVVGAVVDVVTWVALTVLSGGLVPPPWKRS